MVAHGNIEASFEIFDFYIGTLWGRVPNFEAVVGRPHLYDWTKIEVYTMYLCVISEIVSNIFYIFYIDQYWYWVGRAKFLWWIGIKNFFRAKRDNIKVCCIMIHDYTITVSPLVKNVFNTKIILLKKNINHVKVKNYLVYFQLVYLVYIPMYYFCIIFVSSSTFVKLAVNAFECVKVLHHKENMFTIPSIQRPLASR